MNAPVASVARSPLTVPRAAVRSRGTHGARTAVATRATATPATSWFSARGRKPASSGIWARQTKRPPKPSPGQSAVDDAGPAGARPQRRPARARPARCPASRRRCRPRPARRGVPRAARPDQHRQRGGTDARDGGDHAHPAGGQSAVEERRTDAVAQAGAHGPAEVGGLRCAADERGQDQDGDGAGELGDHDDGPGTGPLATGHRRRSRPGRRTRRRAARARRRPCQVALTWPGRRRPR